MRLSEITGSQKLFEMPYLMAGQIDWGLEDPEKNALRATLILNTPHEIIQTFKGGGKLYHRTLPHGGDFAYINKNKIGYFMQYETSQREGFGRCATQVKVWSTIAIGPIGLAEDVFFNIMLQEYVAMISDRIQSEDGRKFWLRRMAQATEKELHVGLLDHGLRIDYDSTLDWSEWLTQVDGWGKEAKHHDRLFYISKV